MKLTKDFRYAPSGAIYHDLSIAIAPEDTIEMIIAALRREKQNLKNFMYGNISITMRAAPM